MDRVLPLAFLAALNPTLLTATTLMLLMENPRKLMLGYLAGAMLTSITIGTWIVFSLDDSSVVSTTQHSLSPAANIVFGVVAIALAWVLSTGREGRVTERRKAKEKGPPRWQQALGRGSARITFVVGAMLTLPGASYLVGLHRIHQLDASDAGKFGTIVVFNLIMLALLELPLISFAIAPEKTEQRIERGKAWVARNGRRYAVRALLLIGSLLVVRGVLEAVS